KSDQLVGELQLGFEPRGALLQFKDAPVLRVELRLSAGRALSQPLAAMQRQLLAPGGQQRAVDPLPSQKRLDGPALGARGGLAHDPQLLGGGEPAPLAGRRLALDRGSANPVLRWRGARFRLDGEMGWLGHVSGSILRPRSLISRGSLSQPTLAQGAPPLGRARESVSDDETVRVTKADRSAVRPRACWSKDTWSTSDP